MMISISKFKDEDMDHLMNMIYNRDLNSSLANDLPEHGYIAFCNMAPVAVGFLRICESDLAIMDSVMTNPQFESEIRHWALEGIISALMDDARHFGIKKILAYSIDDGIRKRAKSFGFKELPQVLMCAEVGD